MTTAVQEIPLEKIAPDPHQPRQHFDQGELDELAASIADRGVLQPIVVSPNGGDGFVLVAGERRWRSSGIAGQSTIPALVRAYDNEADRYTDTLTENMKRADLLPLEEAEAFRHMTKDLDLSQADVARRVGCSEAHVSKRLAVLSLPKVAREALADGRITMGDAVGLATLKKHSAQFEIAMQAIPDPDADDDGFFHQDVSDVISAALDDVERQKRIDSVTKELEKSGETVVPWEKFRDWKSNWRPVRADEPHEAFVVNTAGSPVKVTTKPVPDDKSLRGRAKNATADERKRQAAARERRQRWETITTARHGACQAVLTGRRLAKDALVGYVVAQNVQRDLDAVGPFDPDTELACQFLDLKTKGGADRHEKALAEFAAGGTVEQLKAAAALTFAAIEGELKHDPAPGDTTATPYRLDRWKSPAVLVHMGALVDLAGYQPTPEENDLAAPAPEKSRKK